jgi:hypothetical protein
MIKGVPTNVGKNQYVKRGNSLRPGKLFPSSTQNAVSITMKEQPIEMMCVPTQSAGVAFGSFPERFFARPRNGTRS